MPNSDSLEALYQNLDTLSPTHRALFFRLLRKEGETLAQLGVPRRTVSDAPLSYAQERIWNAGRRAPAGGVDNVPLAVHLTGTLDTEVLRRSFEAMADRHEILRSSIHVNDGEPRLVVQENWSLPFEVVHDDASEDDLRRRAAQSFDLASDSLLRVTLYQPVPSKYVLLVVMHQLAGDGLSLRLMLNELSALYAAGGDAEAADLPDQQVEYADVSMWQRTWMSKEDLGVQRRYWHERLAGRGTPTRLSGETVDEVAVHPSAAEPVRLSDSLSRAIRQTATAHGATPYMTLLAGLYVTLAAKTGEMDVTVASLVSSRTLPETETLLGNFSNTLLLRQQLNDAPSFSDFLRQVKGNVLDAYRHQEYPFVEVQRFLNEETAVSEEASPYEVLLIVRDSKLQDALRLPGVEGTAELIDLGLSRRPFSIDLVDNGESPIQGGLTYATDLFERGDVRTFVDELITVLERAMQDPTVSVQALRALVGSRGESEPSSNNSASANRSRTLDKDIQKIGF